MSKKKQPDTTHKTPAGLSRREFLEKAAAAAAGVGMVSVPDTAQAKKKDENTQAYTWIVDDEPLTPKGAKESTADYGKRYAASFERHINEYRMPMVKAMADTSVEYPLAAEFVAGYRCCIMPAGKPLSGAKPLITLPTILLENPVKAENNKVWWKQMITEVEVTRGRASKKNIPTIEMTIKIRINKTGTGVGFYGGMKGCDYRIIKSDLQIDDPEEKAKRVAEYKKYDLVYTGAWEKFPAGDKEQQKTVLPPAGAAKAGDIVEIRIPHSVFMASAKQLHQVAPKKFQEATGGAQEGSAIEVEGFENIASAQPAVDMEAFAQAEADRLAFCKTAMLTDPAALSATERLARRDALLDTVRNL